MEANMWRKLLILLVCLYSTAKVYSDAEKKSQEEDSDEILQKNFYSKSGSTESSVEYYKSPELEYAENSIDEQLSGQSTCPSGQSSKDCLYYMNTAKTDIGESPYYLKLQSSRLFPRESEMTETPPLPSEQDLDAEKVLRKLLSNRIIEEEISDETGKSASVNKEPETDVKSDSFDEEAEKPFEEDYEKQISENEDSRKSSPRDANYHECNSDQPEVFVKEGETHIFSTPSYPKEYESDTNCGWSISSVDKKNWLYFWCSEFDLAEDDHLYLGDHSNPEKDQRWYKNIPRSFISEGYSMKATLISYKKSSKALGFQCYVKIIDPVESTPIDYLKLNYIIEDPQESFHRPEHSATDYLPHIKKTRYHKVRTQNYLYDGGLPAPKETTSETTTDVTTACESGHSRWNGRDESENGWADSTVTTTKTRFYPNYQTIFTSGSESTSTTTVQTDFDGSRTSTIVAQTFLSTSSSIVRKIPNLLYALKSKGYLPHFGMDVNNEQLTSYLNRRAVTKTATSTKVLTTSFRVKVESTPYTSNSQDFAFTDWFTIDAGGIADHTSEITITKSYDTNENLRSTIYGGNNVHVTDDGVAYNRLDYSYTVFSNSIGQPSTTSTAESYSPYSF